MKSFLIENLKFAGKVLLAIWVIAQFSKLLKTDLITMAIMGWPMDNQG